MNILHGMCTHMGSDNCCTFADQVGHIPVDKGVTAKEKRKGVTAKGKRNVQSVVVKEHNSVSSAGMLLPFYSFKQHSPFSRNVLWNCFDMK
jgi:hypothetical protein